MTLDIKENSVSFNAHESSALDTYQSGSLIGSLAVLIAIFSVAIGYASAIGPSSSTPVITGKLRALCVKQASLFITTAGILIAFNRARYARSI